MISPGGPPAPRGVNAPHDPPVLLPPGTARHLLPFGKELVLLAWAIEDADPGRVQTAVANWLGLKPEERWWLYTMTNAATGQALAGRNVGWRVAVRYALCENPIRGMSTETRVGLIAGLDEEEKGPVDKKQVTFADLARE